MEGSSFNSGFLGANFQWWIGQIVDDVYWRGNISPEQHENRHGTGGQGYRYKVRIIGLHDISEKKLPSEKLPWAQVMYPVTAGGGQNFSSQTPNLQQGSMVFGFFLDVMEEQVPIIMGVMGTSNQIKLNHIKQKPDVSDKQPGSIAITGSSESRKSRADKDDTDAVQKEKRAPDEGISVQKPRDIEAEKESSPEEINKFYVGKEKDGKIKTKGIKFSPRQLADFLQAREDGLEVEEAVKRVIELIGVRKDEIAKPSAPTSSGATIEGVDDPHLKTVADKKQEKKCRQKIHLMKASDMTGSAIKGMQVVIDEYTSTIESYLDSINDYAEAASQIVDLSKQVQREAYTKGIACALAKYAKVIFDKILEYVLKLTNVKMSDIIALIPPTLHSKMGDMQEIIIKALHCLYNKIIDSLCGKIHGMLDDKLDFEKKINDEKNYGSPRGSDGNGCLTSRIPICTAETFIGELIHSERERIDSANNQILDSIDEFLETVKETVGTAGDALDLVSDIPEALEGITGIIDGISDIMESGIDGSMTDALSLVSIVFDMMGCDLDMDTPDTDYYTFCGGGSAQSATEKPSLKEIDNLSGLGEKQIKKPNIKAHPGFFQPSQTTPDINLRESTALMKGEDLPQLSE